MSLNIIKGNIFTSRCQTIVNTVNCEGVMGAGIALECRLRYPAMFERYVQLCSDGQIGIGLLWIYKSADRWLLNFPTKKHWKYPSKKEYLHSGLEKFVATYKEKGIRSIAFPLLGADRGGIDKDESLDLMANYLSQIDVEVEIYKYDKNANDDLYEKTKLWISGQNVEFISESTKLRRDYVVRLVEAMKDPSIHQLNQLATVDGVGIKTLERIFSFSCNALGSTSADQGPQQILI